MTPVEARKLYRKIQTANKRHEELAQAYSRGEVSFYDIDAECRHLDNKKYIYWSIIKAEIYLNLGPLYQDRFISAKEAMAYLESLGESDQS